jgi:hypothetical protein
VAVRWIASAGADRAFGQDAWCIEQRRSIDHGDSNRLIWIKAYKTERVIRAKGAVARRRLSC